MPHAPGHSGSLVGVALAYGLSRVGTLLYWLALVAIVAMGIVAADRYGAWSGKADDQRIVIDEVAGVLLTLSLGTALGGPFTPWPLHPVSLLLGFLLFRLFDVWKPPPVRTIDRRLGGGLGVMADDLAAAVYAAAIYALIFRLGLPARLFAWIGG